jgi:hypothetical protein
VTTEADLAACVVSWLEDQGAEVWQEVQDPRGGPGGPIADIVAARDDTSLVVECKLTMCLEVLAQAHRWRPMADRVCIAIPRGRKSYTRQFGSVVAQQMGIGVLLVDGGGTVLGSLPRARRREHHPFGYVLDWVTPEHKTRKAAGTKGGGYVTPFRLWADAIESAARVFPGITAGDALDLDDVPSHYANANVALQQMTKLARVVGRKENPEGPLRVKLVRIGGKPRRDWKLIPLEE